LRERANASQSVSLSSYSRAPRMASGSGRMRTASMIWGTLSIRRCVRGH
jgi:hypothetical protein